MPRLKNGVKLRIVTNFAISHPFSHGMLSFPVSKKDVPIQAEGVKTTHLPVKIPTPHQQINTREKRR